MHLVRLKVITTLELKTGPYFYPRSSLKPKFGKSIYRYDIWRSASQKTNLLMSKLSFWQPEIKIMLKSFISTWYDFHKNWNFAENGHFRPTMVVLDQNSGRNYSNPWYFPSIRKDHTGLECWIWHISKCHALVEDFLRGLFSLFYHQILPTWPHSAIIVEKFAFWVQTTILMIFFITKNKIQNDQCSSGK